ncbi:cob(I)yrinic acid a,c-diamide adenosyltransferase [Consotaella salsifontis]|uniref:Corrinoid adenosyltransferase n=1 Tax=Consotaella salsifontis TaxID=1365950 RepID=A0A1T4RRY9_9HYPH|nr:cob(I)yrinic acid a,c-diamide adenosyltransferase [Consotaella salsifontis]SKA18734.1 ATP:cob(I)alamin adenosyltransferase [Consotaella salsifontis]
MVKLNRIYTRTGDAGTTGLATGERRSKSDARFAAIGDVDETNATLGLCRLSADAALDAILARIQNDLFDLGADLAVPANETIEGMERLAITEGQVERLEREIDDLNGRLEPLRSFILPAGSAAASHLHLARTVARRAERSMVFLAMKEEGTVTPTALKYINRLSDLLFVAARIANDEGRADVLWKPGATR